MHACKVNTSCIEYHYITKICAFLYEEQVTTVGQIWNTLQKNPTEFLYLYFAYRRTNAMYRYVYNDNDDELVYCC